MSFSKTRRFPVSPKNFETPNKHSSDSEETDSDDDERERRKYISLKGGQCLLWSASKFGNNWDLTQDYVKYFPEHDNINPADKSLKSSFKRNIDGRHSLRQIRLRVAPLNLDNIQINDDFEYGFNPKRLTGSKANNTVRLRPLSLYSPPSEQRTKIVLKSTISDAEKYVKNITNQYSTENFLKRTASYARNDFEAQLEKKVLLLRAQPCDLKFQGSKGKVNEVELAEDMAIARRRRFVRRQLSFDSHPRKRWRKTLSLDSGLATDSLRSLKSRSFSFKDHIASKSDDTLDANSNNLDEVKVGDRTCKSVEFLDITPVAGDAIDAQSDATICASSDLSISHEKSEVEANTFNLLPPPPVEKLPENELLLSMPEKITKPLEKPKRRTSFPQILSAFRLPNKRTFQKFIRKKNHEPELISVSPNVTKDETVRYVSPTKDEPSVPITFSDKSINSYSNAASFDKSTENIGKSSSSYSLPRVDEDKESFEFESPLERRSKSSCSISFSKSQHVHPNQDGSLQRRMSDTVLSSHERYIGCSPGRKFVRRLLSPVVCGLPAQDKYNMLNDSIQSLASYDSASITSDSDIAYPQLFDFGSQELAEEMTIIDKELLVRIPWEELSTLGWMAEDKLLLAPNIMKMVRFFNRIAMLISTNVLHEETPFRRAKIIRKVIKLACRCRLAKNYNSLKAVLGGLQCTPIFRLKATWKQVPPKYRRMFRELSELMSENNNFSIYRQELSISLRNPPCIPFLGNFLTQVAHTHAYMAVQIKYKQNSFIMNKVSDNTPNNDHTKNILERTTSLNASAHTRTDSDDSGVVLNRFSHASDDYEASPRESCMSSPDEEGRRFEDVFNKPDLMLENGFHMTSLLAVKKCKSFQNVSKVRQISHKKSVSVDNGDMRRKQFNDIANVINNRPVDRDRGTDELYECELMFWKYQISAVQYNFLSRSYIRRYLMNSPYSTEEENYTLSLKREPPSR